MLSREQALSSAPMLKTEKIPVPEFGDAEEIAIRSLTAKQRWAFGQMAAKSDDGKSGPEPTSYLITLAAIDDAGKTLFQTQDCDIIAEWPGDLVDRIGTRIMQMSGLSSNAVDEAKKDSSETSSDSGLTESPETSPAPSPS